MPDWSYQTVLRPLLFVLPAEKARDLTLKTIGTLASLPFGPSLIDIMGHMRPPPELCCSALGLTFPSPVGLGAGLDTLATACSAFARFGFGFLEVGPVTLNPVYSKERVRRLENTRGICYPDVPINQGCDHLVARLEKYGSLSIPLGIRLGHQPNANAIEAASERNQLIQRLARFASFFTLECQVELAQDSWNVRHWTDHLAILAEAQSENGLRPPILINLRPDFEVRKVDQLVTAALASGIRGIVVSGGRSEGGNRVVGATTREQSLRMVRFLCAEYGDQVTIIGSGGIQEPRDALDFLDAGAALLQVHSGLVYSGPGLPKRINEALAYHRPAQKESAASRATPGIPAWFWAALLGLGLVISGSVVWAVALTQTVLPYDEAFVGLSRAEMIAINPHLLPFMTHDRVTVAGTMLATGVLYLGMALGGIRRGYHWARQAVSASAIVGFLSFFLFLGFGYLDPLHAVLTAGLLPLLLLNMRRKLPFRATAIIPNLANHWRWRVGQWAQLFFVTIGIGMFTAGVAITAVGVTGVFVPADLHFLDTSAEVLRAANSRLIPLIAHDRAGFGGNLISVGLAILLLSLWGFRQGERWVWWTLALSGLIGFIAGIGIHLVVGYVDLWHLFPAFFALFLFVVGLVLAAPYLLHGEAS